MHLAADPVDWFHHDLYEVSSPMAHLAVALLSEAATWRDPVFCDLVDQIEPSVSGAWGGDSLEERFGIGVARVVAKAAGTEAEQPVRNVLLRAGVSDWGVFVATHVAPNAGPYAASVATFRSREHYRWVAPGDLPAPHNPFRLPPELRSSWDRYQILVRLPRPLRQDPRRVRDRWVRRQRQRRSSAGGPTWRLDTTDWVQVMAAVEQFDSQGIWTLSAVNEFAGSLEPGVSLGFRASLLDPIVCDPTWGDLGNGQHRALVMLVQQVPAVLVCNH
jgi:hypothetical protein